MQPRSQCCGWEAKKLSLAKCNAVNGGGGFFCFLGFFFPMMGPQPPYIFFPHLCLVKGIKGKHFFLFNTPNVIISCSVIHAGSCDIQEHENYLITLRKNKNSTYFKAFHYFWSLIVGGGERAFKKFRILCAIQRLPCSFPVP